VKKDRRKESARKKIERRYNAPPRGGKVREPGSDRYLPLNEAKSTEERWRGRM